MAHAFDTRTLEELIGRVEHVLDLVIEHEHGLASFVDVGSEEQSHLRDTPSPNLKGSATRLSGVPPACDLDTSLRGWCSSARRQRELIEGLLAELVGPRNRSQDGRRVLVIDDSEDSRNMAADVLEAFGFYAITASNGLEGLIVAHYAQPTVVVTDLAMPILDGIQAARVLKASSVTQHLNLIAYTAGPNGVEDGPIARLFVEVLRKPVKPEKIVDCVRRFSAPWPVRAYGSRLDA